MKNFIRDLLPSSTGLGAKFSQLKFDPPSISQNTLKGTSLYEVRVSEIFSE